MSIYLANKRDIYLAFQENIIGVKRVGREKEDEISIHLTKLRGVQLAFWENIVGFKLSGREKEPEISIELACVSLEWLAFRVVDT